MEFDNFVNVFRSIQEMGNTSISQYAKPANISSPVFIQRSIVELDDVRNPLLTTLSDIYLGFILVSLNLNQPISDSRTMRDYVSKVSSSFDVANTEFLDISSLTRDFELGKFEPTVESIGQMDTKKLPPLPSGKLVRLEVVADNGTKVPLMVSLNLVPRPVPSEIVPYVIKASFKESIAKRWLRVSSGELSFFKDFLLNLDRLRDREEALKKDRDGILKELFRHRRKSIIKHIIKAVLVGNGSANLANAIVILDEKAVRRTGKKVGFDPDKASDIRSFFIKTFSLFLVLVDADYSQVSIYTNGFDGKAVYSFSDLKKASTKDDVVDMMSFIAKNQIPKF